MKNSNIFMISGPSGAGEDSVIEGIKKYIDFKKITTTTTRKKRPGEIEGKTYYYVTKEEFQRKIKKNDFFEYALEDNGNYYGVTFEEIEKIKKIKKPVIWKVDYQGVISGKKLLANSIAIFIYIPPEIIKKRLKKRDGASEEFIKARIEHARGWYKNEDTFDYKVVNKEGELEETIQKVVRIIKNHVKID